jgi:murein DD-endopeptidase MepM/ murein hydrolase activator NlpD
MFKSKINKFINKHTLYLISIFLIIASVILTNYFSSYKKKQNFFLQKLIENTYLNKTSISIFEKLNPRYEVIEFKVQSGDTFEKLLNQLNITNIEKNKILNKILKQKYANKLKKNQEIIFTIDKKKPYKVLKFSIEISKTKSILFTRNIQSDNFSYKEIQKNLIKKLSYQESEITNSLYDSAIKNGIPPSIIIDFARVYGFQIDFQRDIWKNDSFQLLYETFVDDKEKLVETGNIIFAKLNIQGKDLPLYGFKTKEGYDYFDNFGKSVRKSLMKTPINGARLSSNFGLRKHPILGFNKMHRGTDFAAAKGTPIMASGDGKIIRARWCGGGGNCIKIKHNSTYSTVYAHLSKFARITKEGARVRQGQIIGYVGSTGMSTGPHLHYEVIENEKKINSQKLKLPSGRILKEKQRELFEIEKIRINVTKSELIANLN